MARKKLTPEEKRKRRLERRAAKKAARLNKKTKNLSSYKLIQVAESDTDAQKRLGELRENGIHVCQMAYATGFFIYEVPLNIKGFTECGTHH